MNTMTYLSYLEKYTLLIQKYRNGKTNSLKGFSRRLILYFNFPILNYFMAKKPKQRIKSDILFLFMDCISYERIDLLKKTLSQKKITYVFEKVDTSLRSRKHIFIKNKTPKKIKLFESFVSYILHKYDTKIIITMSDASLINYFVHQNFEGKHINLAHGTIEDTIEQCMFSSDYFFLYGKQSLENIKIKTIRLGSPKYVITGSVFSNYIDIKNQYKRNMPINSSPTTKKKIVYFSRPLFKIDNIRTAMKSHSAFIQWYNENNENYTIYIKPHPNEDVTYTKQIFASLDINYYNVLEPFSEVLNNSYCCITAASNSLFEIASANIPSIVLYPNDFDFWNTPKFFPTVNQNTKLTMAMTKLEDNYLFYKNNCKKFIDNHIDKLDDSTFYIADIIEKILENEENFTSFQINENLEGLV